MGRLFGTDGVRGVANRDLTPDLALALGRAAGSVLAPGSDKVVVGRDTRLSGPMLEGALVAGLCSAGAGVQVAGIVPSAAVAFLTVETGARAGAVISASHNPVDDNGIKFFSREGVKIPAETEAEIERAMEQPPPFLPTGADIGRSQLFADAAARYSDHLVSSVPVALSDVRVVLDCAFGAAWRIAPEVFARAGAEVQAMNAEADGARINVGCGSTSPAALAERVVAEGADLGLAFDGDADRVLAIDEQGRVVDGDRIMAMCAVAMHDNGELDNDVVVATVMSNLGFVRALEERGIEVVSAPVGDRPVAEAMAQHNSVLGGEQSGHIIFARHSTTGDGILTGLQIAATMASSGQPLSKLAHVFEPYPQVLINVEVARKDDLDNAPGLWEEIAAAERRLGDEGRVLVRASGTEPLVRVMVEAAAPGTARSTAEALAAAVADHLS